MTQPPPLQDTLEHLRLWFRSTMSGCYFANMIAADSSRVVWLERLEDLAVGEVSSLESTIDGAAVLGQVVVVAFPRARATRDAATLLRTLVTSTRWSVAGVPWATAPRDGCTLVGLTYKTSSGDISSVMGLGPFGEMPVTRRAPYMAIALWAGGRKNPRNPHPREGEVGFLDAPLPPGFEADKDMFDKQWAKSREKVGKLLREPLEARRILPQVAFCLPTTEVAELISASGA